MRLVTAFLLAPRIDRGLDALRDADTIIVPGRSEETGPPSERVLAALRQAAGAGTRIASVCVGAFVLAEAGLLDGLRATTHWYAAGELARRYPRVEVQPDVLYVDNGQILTSAGAAAGLDLCLHMIRRDLGSAVAAHAARMCVMPLEREGGQAQFIVHELPPVPRGSALEPLVEWIEDNLAHEITLGAMAARAGTSERTLSRRFREQTGTTPLRWLLRARVRRAQYLLENSDHPVERIAQQAGFGSPTPSGNASARWSAPPRTPTARRSTGSGPPARSVRRACLAVQPRNRAEPRDRPCSGGVRRPAAGRSRPPAPPWRRSSAPW
ncbi:hypothetical protein GCM10010421_36970 [Streptomyces glaucus]|uniref:HTH araC/xylS-type domain-containing protein n=1 Tax=Streptomyces glaucus TaxID=284029 RepID=A0ABN3JWQ8_9ACTN